MYSSDSKLLEIQVQQQVGLDKTKARANFGDKKIILKGNIKSHNFTINSY